MYLTICAESDRAFLDPSRAALAGVNLDRAASVYLPSAAPAAFLYACDFPGVGAFLLTDPDEVVSLVLAHAGGQVRLIRVIG